MNEKTNTYRVDIVSEWRNVLKTPANLHLLSTQLSVLCAMAEEDAIAERDALRERFVIVSAEVMRLVADLGDCRDALQDWQVAAGMRQAERDALRATLREVLDVLKSGRSTGRKATQALYAAEDVIMATLDE